MSQPGSAANPLRVAIIGAVPTGFYTAEHLFKKDVVVEVDMFDRLPTPFGLVRGGVAPDHQKIKSVTRVFDRIAKRPNFRFYGYVELGRDLTVADLTLASPFVNAGYAQFTIDAAKWPNMSALVERVKSHSVVTPLLEAEAAAFGG